MNQSTEPSKEKPRIAILGGTGYVGSRLISQLLRSGYQVHCLARSPQKLTSRTFPNQANLTIAKCNLEDADDIAEKLDGQDIVFYLVHSMRSAGRSYATVDDDLAQNTAKASERAGVQRIIYLGGLGDSKDRLSEHLQSRRDVEESLASTDIPVTTLRAAMIIGSGSASFEILRYLVERLPIMVTPRWVRTESQPIAIADVLQLLEACIEHPETSGQTLDIGGADVVDYQFLMRLVAVRLGLKPRRVIPVPILTPRLSALWIHLVTPVDAAIAQPLAAGLSNRVVCRDNASHELLGRKPLTAAAAIDAALEHTRDDSVESSWTDAGPLPGDPDWSGGRVYTDSRSITVDAPVHAVYEAITLIGGGHGYYAADWLWKLRGIMDRLAGGPGLRRGRRTERVISTGDALDFWRVLHADRDRRLILFAEMKLPGTATLEFSLEQTDENTSIVQTARFRPRGLFGIAYWMAVKPLHGIVFSGMLNGIVRESRRLAESLPGRQTDV